MKMPLDCTVFWSGVPQSNDYLQRGTTRKRNLNSLGILYNYTRGKKLGNTSSPYYINLAILDSYCIHLKAFSTYCLN